MFGAGGVRILHRSGPSRYSEIASTLEEWLDSVNLDRMSVSFTLYGRDVEDLGLLTFAIGLAEWAGYASGLNFQKAARGMLAAMTRASTLRVQPRASRNGFYGQLG